MTANSEVSEAPVSPDLMKTWFKEERRHNRDVTGEGPLSPSEELAAVATSKYTWATALRRGTLSPAHGAHNREATMEFQQSSTKRSKSVLVHETLVETQRVTLYERKLLRSESVTKS